VLRTVRRGYKAGELFGETDENGQREETLEERFARLQFEVEVCCEKMGWKKLNCGIYRSLWPTLTHRRQVFCGWHKIELIQIAEKI
jgi:hypothetical protein